MKSKVIVCDIDGVCLESEFILREIFELGLKGDDKWDYFYKNCNNDMVQEMSGIKTLLELAWVTPFWTVILSTARNEKCREATEEKLRRCGIPFFRLYMRKENDYRDAAEVKREHLQEIVSEFDIVAFIDDDLDNCEMAKKLGIMALRRV